MKTSDSGGERSDLAVNPDTPEPKKDIQSDIDRSVSEILAFSSAPSKDEAKDPAGPLQPSDISLHVHGAPPSCGDPPACPPSVKQLELLELEMRARAIKALMKASDGKKLCTAKNI